MGLKEKTDICVGQTSAVITLQNNTPSFGCMVQNIFRHSLPLDRWPSAIADHGTSGFIGGREEQQVRSVLLCNDTNKNDVHIM